MSRHYCAAIGCTMAPCLAYGPDPFCMDHACMLPLSTIEALRREHTPNEPLTGQTREYGHLLMDAISAIEATEKAMEKTTK